MQLTNKQQNMQDHHQLEDALSKELQKRKLEAQAKQLERDRICDQSEELRALKQKVETAYVSKERSQQLAEQQLRKIQYIQEEAIIEKDLLERNKLEQQREREKQIHQRMERVQVKGALQNQMVQRRDLEKEAHELYLMEKMQVDQVFSKIISEDKKLKEDDLLKKKQIYQVMQNALQDKADQIQKLKDLENQENQKYLQFIIDKDSMAQSIKQRKEEQSAAKEILFLKLKEDEERRKQDEEMLINLRQELYQEQYEAQNRQKEKDELEKKHKTKLDLQDAQREAMQRKEKQRQEEISMEAHFRDVMLRKFAEDDRIEQLNQQKRRVKEQEHRREVERLWQDRLKKYREEKEREHQEHICRMESEKYKQEVIRAERDRILREHMMDIEDFAPKGLLNNFGEKKYLSGEEKYPHQYKETFKIM